jgi:hypothetical protein
VLNDDLLSQDSTFKSRLEEKRKKKTSQFINITDTMNILSTINETTQLDPIKDVSEIDIDPHEKRNCKFSITLALFTPSTQKVCMSLQSSPRRISNFGNFNDIDDMFSPLDGIKNSGQKRKDVTMFRMDENVNTAPYHRY